MSKIKTFKEFVNENLWADLQDRSSGEVIRKEDDIDHLYNKDLCEYIKERYQAIFNRRFDIEYFGQSVITSRVYIPLYVTTDVWNPQHLISLVIFREPDDSNRTIEIHFRQKKHLTGTFKYFFDKLKNEFDLVVKEGTMKISPKDGGKITNRFFISVLDFCIDNLEKITVKSKYTARLNITRKEVNENLWADLQDRSSGEVTRKEDDINHLEFDEFFVYLKDHYENINGRGGQIGHFRSLYNLGILNIVLSIEKGENICIKYDENKHQILYLEISNTLLSYPKIKQKMDQNYKHYMNDSMFKKSGKITNQDCVNLIDYFLDVVDKPVLKKKS